MSDTVQVHPGPAPQAAKALVLSCIDYRLLGAVADYLRARGLHGRYDQLSLAGGAIGVVADGAEPWARTFWDHLALARTLHGISQVLVIDHRDCGACKAFEGPDCADRRDGELAIHARAMRSLAKDIDARSPGLAVELLLMDLDGSVEAVPRQDLARAETEVS